MASSSEHSSTPPATAIADEKNQIGEHLENVKTYEKVPGHTNYYEKDGLRTYGDDEDHDHEPPMSFRRIMSLIAMAFLWTGSQIPVYVFGGIPPYIYGDIGGADRWVWFVGLTPADLDTAYAYALCRSLPIYWLSLPSARSLGRKNPSYNPKGMLMRVL